MNAIVSWLRGIRASNLIFLCISPVVIFLIVTSRSYGPALRAIIGVEDSPFTLLFVFLVAGGASAAGFYGAFSILRSMRPDDSEEQIKAARRRAAISLTISVLLGLVLAASPQTAVYLVSVVVNEYDPRSVDWIIVRDNSFMLDPAFQSAFLVAAKKALFAYSGLALVTLLWSLAGQRAHATTLGRLSWIALAIFNFGLAFYVLMVAHAGFAVGLMVTLRAAFFAYIGASILGMVWALLTRLGPSTRALLIIGAIGSAMVLSSFFFFTRPQEHVALVGSLDGRIGIVAGTPQALADTVRYGEFQSPPPKKQFTIRSLASTDQALKLLEGGFITAALLPRDKIGDRAILFETSYLKKTTMAIGVVDLVLGAMLVLLVGVGKLIDEHPLRVFSDFFVDTIRGVPMLVIILYVGLPLAGALKSASAGLIDLQMMTRGIIAIAIGYSAYMAEIFRAGIEAIPKGQIEAARTLGLRELQVARLVIVPQAVAIVLPALGNEFIAMLKDTSLVSILSVRDLTQRMREFQAQSFLAFQPFNSAALIYVLLTLIAASGIKSLDRIVNRGKSHEL